MTTTPTIRETIHDAFAAAGLEPRPAGDPPATETRSAPMELGGSDPEFGPLADWARPGASNTDAGILVNETTALQSIPVFSAVTTIAEALGQMPFNLYRRLDPYGKERVPAGQHPAARLFDLSSSTDSTSQSTVETTTIHALLWGTGYRWINRDRSGDPLELLPLPPDKTEPSRRDRETREMIFTTELDGQKFEIPDSDLIRITGPSLNGMLGIKRIHATRDAIGVSLAADATAGSAFKNSVTPSGAIEHPKPLGPNAARNLQNYVEQQHARLDRKHRVLILSEGAKFNPYKIDLQASQLLASRQYSVDEAGRLFRVPSMFLNQTKDGNFSIGETMFRYFVTITLGPWGKRWRLEATRKLIDIKDQAELFLEHTFQSLLMGDFAGRSAFYREMSNLGAMMPSDIRERENLNPYADGSGMVPLVNAATIPLTQAEKGTTPPAGGSRSAEQLTAEQLAELEAEETRGRIRITKEGADPPTIDDVDPQVADDVNEIPLEPDPPPAPPSPPRCPAAALVTASQVAAITGIPTNATRKRLDRWRAHRENAEDWTEVPDPGVRKPAIFYRWGAIAGLFEDD